MSHSKAPKLTERLQVCVAPEVAERLRERADEVGSTTSGLARALLKRALDGDAILQAAEQTQGETP